MKTKVYTIREYTTDDGLTFKDKNEALAHEKSLKNSNRNVKLSNGKVLNRSDIKEFFNTVTCDICPFGTECDAMYDRIRGGTTDVFTICEALLKLN